MGTLSPRESDGHLGVEIESPGVAGGLHDIEQGLRRIDPHAEERIIDAPAQGFQIRPEIRDFPPLDPECGAEASKTGRPKTAASGWAAESSRNAEILSAGCWPSASIVSTWVNPAATASRRPWRTAAPLPEFTGRRMMRKSGFSKWAIVSSEPSVEPSMITQTGVLSARTPVTVRARMSPVL